MISADILLCLRPVVEAFSSLGILYEVGGSLASSAYGMARATMDIDIAADLELDHVKPLVEMLAPSFYVDEHAALEAIRTESSFNLIHQETMLKVDVFITKDRPYDRLAMDRRRAEQLVEGEDFTVFFSSPEDTILNKLMWYRLGQETSDRQWTDILGVLKVQQGRLDDGYLQRWAEELGVGDLLDRALTDSATEQP